MGTRGSAADLADSAPRAGTVRRYLSCLRYRDILLLQGSPLLGAVFAMGPPSAARLPLLPVFAAASILLVAHVFVLNDWAGLDADLNDTSRAASVFAAKGVSRGAIRRLWLALLLASLALFALLGPLPLAIAVAIAGLSFLYSWCAAPAKGVPVLGTALHLTGGTLHFLLGFSLFREIDGRGVALGLFFGLAFAAGHLNQEVRDFDGDARNRIRTNAVTFGKRPAFLAGLALFTAAYALLTLLAVRGILPGWLAWLFPLYLLHLGWSLRTLAAGLRTAGVRRFQARYRALFAVVGAAMLAALLTSPAPPAALPARPGTPPAAAAPASQPSPAVRPAAPAPPGAPRTAAAPRSV